METSAVAPGICCALRQRPATSCGRDCSTIVCYQPGRSSCTRLDAYLASQVTAHAGTAPSRREPGHSPSGRGPERCITPTSSQGLTCRAQIMAATTETIADLGYGPACLARSGAPAPGQHAARCEPLWAANHARASRHAWTTTVTRRPSSTGCRTARICRTGTHAGTTSLPTAWWRSFRNHQRQIRPVLSPAGRPRP